MRTPTIGFIEAEMTIQALAITNPNGGIRKSKPISKGVAAKAITNALKARPDGDSFGVNAEPERSTYVPHVSQRTLTGVNGLPHFVHLVILGAGELQGAP
jgi:hypothetical protein